MLQIYKLAKRFSKSLALFILIISIGFPLTAQNQYWQVEFRVSALNNAFRGTLTNTDLGVKVETGSQQISFSGMGRGMWNKNTLGSWPNTPAIFTDVRDDLYLVAAQHSLDGSIKFHGFDSPTSSWNDMLFEADFGAVLTNSYEVPPVVLKGEPLEYFFFDDQFIYKFDLPVGGTPTLLFKKAHNSDAIMDAVYFNGHVYACDRAGKIHLFDETGNETLWSFDNFQLYGINRTANDFILTGSKDGQAQLLNISTAGQLNWSESYNQAQGIDCIQSLDGGFLVTGKTFDDTGFVIKTNSTGEMQWESVVLDFPGTQLFESKRGAVYALSPSRDLAIDYELVKLGANGEEGPEIKWEWTNALSANNIEANVSPDGQLFFDGADADYFFPKGAETATLFAAQLWMSATNQSGNPHLSASTYHSYENDFAMGSIGGDKLFANRVWSISQAAIELVQNDLVDGVQNLDWPVDYLQWPAKGNTLHKYLTGESWTISEAYAPFVDVDGDGLYNPFAGDYPKIKGEHMLWWIFNDLEPNFPASEDVGVEIKASLYATGCNSDHIAYNTTFLDYEVVNKSTNVYPEFTMSFWADPALGCFSDNYIGSIPDHNAAFIYNEDATDGDANNACLNDIVTFDELPPIQSIVFLNNNLDNFGYFYNPSIGTPIPGTANANTVEEHLNYMKGLWGDGTPITSGGDGYNPGSTDVVNHCFSGDPSDSNAWSLCSAASAPSDRRILMSSHFTNFNPDDKLEFQMAFITTTGVELPCPSLEKVKADIETIQAVHDQGGTAYFLNLGPAVQSLAAGETLTLDAGAGAASYEWSTGAVSQSIDVVSLGTYSVTVTDWYGCEKIDEVVVQFPSAAINQAAEQSITLYPNPTNDQFSVLTDEPMLSLKMFSVSGQLLKHYNQEGRLGSNDFSTDGLTAGLYLVTVTLADGVYVGKLMVR